MLNYFPQSFESALFQCNFEQNWKAYGNVGKGLGDKIAGNAQG